MLGSPANVRLLRELSRHGGELDASSLALRSGIAVQSVRLALDRLVGQGIVEVKGTGHARLFAVQRAHPLATAFDALFLAEEDRFDAVLGALRAAADEIRSDVEAVWLYGSVARGEDATGSDVDIVVVSARDDVERVVGEFRERLRVAEERLSFTASVAGLDSADVDRLSRSDPWWTEVERDAVTIAGPSPTDLIVQHRRRSTGQTQSRLRQAR